MATLNQLRNSVGRIFDQIGEGWAQLRQRTSQALTRFNPGARNGTEVETNADQVLQRASRWALLPADVVAHEDEIVVRLEAPGMEPDDFEIEVIDNVLVVRGEKRLERERREGRYHLIESAYGSFERAIPLPTEVDDKHARAKYKNGVLSIALPKSERARPQRIEVHAR